MTFIAPVKAVLELGQVAGIVATDRMVSAGDSVLDVAQHGVDPVERRDLRAGSATAVMMRLWV